MAQYGYMSASNGYRPLAQKKTGLASALGGRGATSAADPYGLAAAASGRVVQPVAPVTPDGWMAGALSRGASAQAPPVKAPTQPPVTAPGTPSAAAVSHYDLNTDPALQQINSLVGQSDEQAQASAQKQRYNQLLAYGDPNLALKTLGDNSLATAAAGNPTSTLSQLGTQRTRNVRDLTEGMNKNNLLYSGYRVTQEQQAAQDYQSQLAQAAAGVNSNLDAIGGNLSQALAGNQATREQALREAADRVAQQNTAAAAVAQQNALADALAQAAGGGGGGGAAAAGGGGGGGTELPPRVPATGAGTTPTIYGTPGGGTAGGGHNPFFPGAATRSRSGLDLLAAALNNTIVNPATQPGTVSPLIAALSQPKRKLASAAVGNRGARALGFY